MIHWFGQYVPKVFLHQRIRADIESRIRSGEWPPGTVLATEMQLREQYGVSRSTAQRALRDLAQAGLVVRRPRIGTVVAQTVTEENLMRWTNLLAEGPELHGDHRVLDAGVVPAEDTGVDLPGVSPEAAVIRMRRVKHDARDRAVGSEVAVIPFEVAPRILDEDLGPLTTLAYFHRVGVPISRARLYVEPAIASDDDAALLDCASGGPLFRIRRETYLEDGSLAEVFESLLLPDTIRLFVEQSVASSSASRTEASP